MQSWTQEWLCLTTTMGKPSLKAGASTVLYPTSSELLAYTSTTSLSTSGTSELPSNDNLVPPVELSPTAPVYMLFLQPTENYPHASLAGRVSARHHRYLNNPYQQKRGRKDLPQWRDARQQTPLQLPVLQLPPRTRILPSKTLLM